MSLCSFELQTCTGLIDMAPFFTVLGYTNRLATTIISFAGRAKFIIAIYAKRLWGVALSIMDPDVANSTRLGSIWDCQWTLERTWPIQMSKPSSLSWSVNSLVLMHQDEMVHATWLLWWFVSTSSRRLFLFSFVLFLFRFRHLDHTIFPNSVVRYMFLNSASACLRSHSFLFLWCWVWILHGCMLM